MDLRSLLKSLTTKAYNAITDNRGFYQRGKIAPIQQAQTAITNNYVRPLVNKMDKTYKSLNDYVSMKGIREERSQIKTNPNLGTQKMLAAAKAAPGAAWNTFGLAKGGLTLPLFSGALTGAFSKATGGSFKEGFRSGVATSPSIGAFTSFSNPMINRIAGRVAAPITSPVGKYAVSSVARGLGNIPEGIGIRRSLGVKGYGAGDAAIDFATGLIPGSPNTNIKVKGVSIPKGIDPKDTKEVGEILKRVSTKYLKGGKIDLDTLTTDTKTVDRLMEHYFRTPKKELSKIPFEQKIQELWREGMNDYRNMGNLSMGLVGKNQSDDITSLKAEAKERFKINVDNLGKANNQIDQWIRYLNDKPDEALKKAGYSFKGGGNADYVSQSLVNLKKQLNKATQATNPLDALKTEARKYKSAEEFVKGNYDATSISNSPEMIKWLEQLNKDLKTIDRMEFIKTIPVDKKGKFTISPEKLLAENIEKFNKKYGTNITRSNFLLGENLPERNDLLINKINNKLTDLYNQATQGGERKKLSGLLSKSIKQISEVDIDALNKKYIGKSLGLNTRQQALQRGVLKDVAESKNITSDLNYSPFKDLPLTPEQQAAKNKLPSVMFTTSKTKAEYIPGGIQAIENQKILGSQQLESQSKQTLQGQVAQLQGIPLETSSSPKVYHAEPQPKTPEAKADQNLKEWSDMLFKDAVKREKESVSQSLKSIQRSVGETTDKALQERYVSRAKSGNIVISKNGTPINKSLMESARTWKDKTRLLYARETIERNFEDVMGKDAPMMVKKYIDPVRRNEADRIRWLNRERSEIKSLGIKARSPESKLIQKYGEGKINKSELSQALNGDANKIQKVQNAVDFFRAKYDTYLNDINEVLKRNGYDPIPKRKDYFIHFQEVTNVLEQIGIPMRDNALPTDVNGLTMDFKPGKNFFSSALPRLTDETDFDAITGIDRYIDGASKQIFHTDDIQSLRLLEKGIRETYAGTKHLTNFVADLGEYTNTLAGKKAKIDRAFEEALGRGVYAVSDRLRKQVGSNMVGANVSSALTNYIPLTHALATTDKPSFIRGMLDTIGTTIKNDGLSERSDFLTRRRGSDRLSMRLWDKVGDKAGWLFKTVDRFVSETIVRGKYYEGLKKGLSQADALQNADDYAARVMADRSLGGIPTLFNSKTLGFITQFQLEVNNQLSFMFKDIPRRYDKVGMASALGQIFLYSYLFNDIFEKVTGRRPAFDPIGVAIDSYNDYSDPNMKKGQATKNTIKRVAQQLPFTSIIEGGRLPIGAAIPDVAKLATRETTWEKEIQKPLYYLLPPTGGGQIKKTLEGIGAYKKGYSESDSGRVRFPINQTAGNAVSSGLFGQWATPEAQKYLRKGQSTLGEKQSQIFKSLQGQDKKDYYNTIISNRTEKNTFGNLSPESKATQKSYEEKSGVPSTTKPKKEVDIYKKIEFPKLNDNTPELNKQLISQYKSDLTKQKNAIVKAEKEGKISSNEAETLLSKLVTQSEKATKPKKGVAIKIGKVKAPKFKKISSKSYKIKLSKFKSKKPKTLSKKYSFKIKAAPKTKVLKNFKIA